MQQRFDFHQVLLILKKNKIISQIEIITVDEIAKRGSFKVRCYLIPSRYKLEMRFIKTEKEIIYSYQLFTDKPIIRWDNAPHYPEIRSYPHHFHSDDGKVTESELKGIAAEDLQLVLSRIRGFINS